MWNVKGFPVRSHTVYGRNKLLIRNIMSQSITLFFTHHNVPGGWNKATNFWCIKYLNEKDNGKLIRRNKITLEAVQLQLQFSVSHCSVNSNSIKQGIKTQNSVMRMDVSWMISEIKLTINWCGWCLCYMLHFTWCMSQLYQHWDTQCNL